MVQSIQKMRQTDINPPHLPKIVLKYTLTVLHYSQKISKWIMLSPCTQKDLVSTHMTAFIDFQEFVKEKILHENFIRNCLTTYNANFFIEQV